GIACDSQRTQCFDDARIFDTRRPAISVLQNVKNLTRHDGGKIFSMVMQTQDELGCYVADSQDMGADDPKIIDGKYFLPQHRERIVLVGFRRDLNLKGDFTLRDIPSLYPARRPSVADLLEPAVDAKFILTPVLWKYLYR
ncbi:DNA cytosine methyltransferase, partial [Enterobacter quasiroggenkampii]|uniref:DNA cytosine methyltransferase n=1 Tax=Enterobacter quasiroggenkampii TaxID=2497436 RepID=UPI0021CFA5B2